MSRRSVDELVAAYLRAGGKITVCPPGRGQAYLSGHWKDISRSDVYLNNPEISEAAFPRRELASPFAYGELDDPKVLEREMVMQELADLGRLEDAS